MNYLYSNDEYMRKNALLAYDYLDESKEEELSLKEILTKEILDSKYGERMDVEEIEQLVDIAIANMQHKDADTEDEPEEEASSSNYSTDEETEGEEEDEEDEYIDDSDYEDEVAAISNVRKLAFFSSEKIIINAMEAFKSETGVYPSLDTLAKGFEVVKNGLFAVNEETDCEEEDEKEEEEITSEEDRVVDENDDYGDELEEALNIASEIGRKDQIYMVNKICDTFYEINDYEANLDELRDIFYRIKEELMDEAMDDLLDKDLDEMDDDNDNMSEYESDSDYYITSKDILEKIQDDIDLYTIEKQENDARFINESESDGNEYDSSYNPNYDSQNYDNDYELYYSE